MVTKLETIFFLQDTLILGFFLLLKNGGDIAEAMCIVERLESDMAFRSAVDIMGDHPALVSFIKGVWARKCPPLEEAHVIYVLPSPTSTTTLSDDGSSPLAGTTAQISVQGYSTVAPSDAAEQEYPPSLTSTTVDQSVSLQISLPRWIVEKKVKTRKSKKRIRHLLDLDDNNSGLSSPFFTVHIMRRLLIW
jgi:hypothetical protein